MSGLALTGGSVFGIEGVAGLSAGTPLAETVPAGIGDTGANTATGFASTGGSVADSCTMGWAGTATVGGGGGGAMPRGVTAGFTGLRTVMFGESTFGEIVGGELMTGIVSSITGRGMAIGIVRGVGADTGRTSGSSVDTDTTAGGIEGIGKLSVEPARRTVILIGLEYEDGWLSSGFAWV